jgi:hypothetical protein
MSCALAAGCYETGETNTDAGPSTVADSGPGDAGDRHDSGAADAGVPDATGEPDSARDAGEDAGGDAGVILDPTKCVDEPFDLGAATVWAAPANIAEWSETTKITRIDFRTDGMHIEFDKADGPDRWPDYTPPGWDGPIQYTLWLALFINGGWHTSGIIQYWYGLDASGGDVTQNNQIAINWVYDGRWGPMQGHQPAPGEKVGFMVSAGNARGVPDDSQTIVKERSAMALVLFPAAAGVSVNCEN